MSASLYDGILVKGTLRYRLNKNFVSPDSVPQEVKDVLTADNIVDENGMIVVDQKVPAASEPTNENVEELEKEGATVSFYDPFVLEYKEHGVVKKGETSLTAELIESSDLVIVTTAHTNVDYSFVQKHAKAIFDTKNAMKMINKRENIELL